MPDGQAEVIFAEENFWGRTIAACGSSTDPDCFGNFGPFPAGFSTVPYDNIEALEKRLIEQNGRTAAFMVEPIQGEAGVKVPAADYLDKVAYFPCPPFFLRFLHSGISRIYSDRFLECTKTTRQLVLKGAHVVSLSPQTRSRVRHINGAQFCLH